MNKLIPLTLALSTLSLGVFAKAPVIYGVDNRKEVFEAPLEWQELAKSTATMIKNEDIVPDKNPALVQINQLTLKEYLESQMAQQEDITEPKMSSKLLNEIISTNEKMSVCSNERFTTQPAAGLCSGFLIGPDLLLTAGHCASIESACEKFKWVFDFKVDRKTSLAGVDVPVENVYSCKKVVSQALNMDFSLDYAVVVLDRKVTERKPLKIQSKNLATTGTPLVVIGSPMGLPLKVADGASIRKSEAMYFTANLDTFEGNSGSPVFNKDTMEVEGILVRGEDDFALNTADLCLESKRCEDGECAGEAVSRLTAIPEISMQKILHQAASSGDEATIDHLLKLNLWVDIYGENGVSPLMRASKNQLVSIMDKLIKNGADVNLIDDRGDSPLHYLMMNLSDKNVLALTLLISSGASLEIKNHKGETPLLTAARWLNLSAVKLLIAAGADKAAINQNGETIMDIFRNAGDAKGLDELMALGVDAPLAPTQSDLLD